MARIPPKGRAVPVGEASGSWPIRLLLGARRWRLGLGTAGLAVLVLVIAAVLVRELSHAWSIEQSIEAMRPYRALHLHGTGPEMRGASCGPGRPQITRVPTGC